MTKITLMTDKDPQEAMKELPEIMDKVSPMLDNMDIPSLLKKKKKKS